MGGIYFDITIIICLAAVLTLFFRILKQPPVLAYILTGILLGPAGGLTAGLFHIEHREQLAILGQLGITLLLFMLGLELKLKELRSIGKTAAIAGTLQIAITVLLGMGLGMLLGFSQTGSLYFGIATAFSSTIIIVKLLSDKKDLKSLHGKLAIGILLVQDFFAVMTIMFLSGLSGSTNVVFELGLLFLKVIVIFGWIILLSKYVFPIVVHRIARSSEALFLFSLAWVFALTAFMASPFIGFSIEIGGFLAGLSLANAAENFQIIARMKALRDFFITIFFVILGLEMSFQSIERVIVPAILFSIFVLVIKPFIVMGVTGLLGFRKRTSFITGVSLGQLSEFSLIILFLGGQLQVISQDIVTLGILVALTSFVLSTYAVVHTNRLYGFVSTYVPLFERKHAHGTILETDEFASLKNHVVIIGASQMGRSIIHAMQRSGEQIVVVDFDPDIAKKAKDLAIPVVFGDIADPEIQEKAGVDQAKLIISTVSDLEDNLLLIGSVKHKNSDAQIVSVALENEDAKLLYKAGADYVVLPELAGGRHLAKILLENKHLEIIEDYKQKDLAAL
ncbi:MAG: cation:proton antiporter [bacterium]|nr:cation:proton antiporter [bacterium]